MKISSHATVPLNSELCVHVCTTFVLIYLKLCFCRHANCLKKIGTCDYKLLIMLSYDEKSKEYFDNKTVMKLLAKGYLENILQGSCMLRVQY